jgi:exonuclease III
VKIISLNTWGGRAGKESVLNFFKAHKDVDIFCLQEIWSAPFEHLEGTTAGGQSIFNSEIMVYGLQEISSLLDAHASFFRPHHGDNYGLLMLVKKDIEIVDEGEIFVYMGRGYVSKEDIGNHARNIQYVTCKTPQGLRTVVNFHGLWNGKGKGDSDDRLLQSDKIINFLRTLKNPYVLMGDFNLSPDTESLKKFEDFGLRNLIKEYGITSTRTTHYTKPEKFADYTFVSSGIDVKDFKVLPDEVSDHSPLYLEV